jgi:2-oxoisovalerate dehydrogenase E2 component (dihydrolipoyl transacylase)
MGARPCPRRGPQSRQTQEPRATIKLTTLGALGGITAALIINYPEVASIGPINGHRIMDGHVAARFVQRMKRLV